MLADLTAAGVVRTIEPGTYREFADLLVRRVDVREKTPWMLRSMIA